MELGLLSLWRRKLKADVIAVMKYVQALPKKGIVNSTGPGCTGRGKKDIYIKYWESLSHGNLNKTVAFVA